MSAPTDTDGPGILCTEEEAKAAGRRWIPFPSWATGMAAAHRRWRAAHPTFEEALGAARDEVIREWAEWNDRQMTGLPRDYHWRGEGWSNR